MVLALAACGVDSDGSPAASTSSSSTEASPTTTLGTSTAPDTSTSETTTTVPDNGPDNAGQWGRVDLGFVSAYIFVRGGEAALIDTGTSGSASQIEAGLSDLGLGWPDLSTIILTHKHGDHVGSLPAIMEMAADAAAHAGEADIPAIEAPRSVSPLNDGDTIFGLRVIGTPGHTPGHISLLEPGSTLIAGDAINGSDGGVIGPNPRFTPDLETAHASVTVLGGFEYDVVYFGHGEPLLTDGAQLVAALADTL